MSKPSDMIARVAVPAITLSIFSCAAVQNSGQVSNAIENRQISTLDTGVSQMTGEKLYEHFLEKRQEYNAAHPKEMKTLSLEPLNSYNAVQRLGRNGEKIGPEYPPFDPRAKVTADTNTEKNLALHPDLNRGDLLTSRSGNQLIENNKPKYKLQSTFHSDKGPDFRYSNYSNQILAWQCDMACDAGLNLPNHTLGTTQQFYTATMKGSNDCLLEPGAVFFKLSGFPNTSRYWVVYNHLYSSFPVQEVIDSTWTAKYCYSGSNIPNTMATVQVERLPDNETYTFIYNYQSHAWETKLYEYRGSVTGHTNGWCFFEYYKEPSYCPRIQNVGADYIQFYENGSWKLLSNLNWDGEDTTIDCSTDSTNIFQYLYASPYRYGWRLY